MQSAKAMNFLRRWETRRNLSMFTYKDLETKTNAAILIQKVWRRCVTNPSYRVCQLRLLKEFSELTSH